MTIRPDIEAALVKAGGFYRNAAVFLLNTVVAFAAANAAVGAAFSLRDALRDPAARLGPTVARYGLDRVALAYPGLDRRDLVQLLEETARVYENDYEPFVEFRPRAFSGRFVNVSQQGIRRAEPDAPWPPGPSTFNVFVFGGSTTFGLGLADAETIPSRLAARLSGAEGGRPLRVYNLGRSGYVGVQEGVFFESLLVSGVVPDLAIFIDGLNEFYVWPQPLSAELMGRALAAPQTESGRRWGRLAADLPLGRLARSLRRRLAPSVAAEPPGRPSAEAVLAAWRASRRVIETTARAFGVRTLFVWQPVPCFEYDLAHHLFFGEWAASRLRPARMRSGYEMFDRERAHDDDGFLWLADLQKDLRQNLYVDEIHYGSVLCDAIAARVARHMAERGWLGAPPRPAASGRTGPAG